MTGIETVLGVAALLIGLTGAWSPCGFSMVETIGPTGHSGGRPATAAALTTFIPGALIGGVATFGALAVLGDVIHGAGGRIAYGAAALIAVVAALAEARGIPIVPQIRRQLPEHWRRIMPMPLAAGLYGVLLGLGFTTFVLSFGVWALAGMAFAIGDPTAGVVIGLAFGAGRAIPVLVLAPVCDRPSGMRATEAMTQRPGLYLGARKGDALALMTCAVALTVAPATAATSIVKDVGDPSAAGTDLAFEKANGNGILVRADGERVGLPGTDPAIGGPYLALHQRNMIAVLNRRTLEEVGRFVAPGADALAVSRHWLVWRSRRAGDDSLNARSISDAGRLGDDDDEIVSVDSPANLGRPSLDTGTLVYSRAGTLGSSVFEREMKSGEIRNLLSTRQWLFSSPSVRGDAFSYVRTTNTRQEVYVRKLGAKGPGGMIYRTPATSYRDSDQGAGPHHKRLPTRIPPPDRRRTNTQIAGTTLTKDTVYLTLQTQRGGDVSTRIARAAR